jgi:hypothetical protein
MKDLVIYDEETNKEKFEGEVYKDLEEGAAFFVAFDIKGEPLDIIPSPGCKLLAVGPDTSDSLKSVLDLIKETRGEQSLSDAGCRLIHVHKSPGCYILTASGRLKCVCCG